MRPLSDWMDNFELERLYDEHADALFAFLLNVTRDESDTRDLMQEVFVKLARQPALPVNLDNERAFLIRLSHNAAIDLARRRGARAKYQGAFAEDQPIFSQSGDPDEAAFRQELDRALADLPAEQRTVVHLKLWEQMTFEQIAEALSISPNTAASRYRYGLDKMRERLRPLYDEINIVAFPARKML